MYVCIIQNLDFTKSNASTYNQNYIHLFYILCCHSGSFKLAELGKDLKFLEVISKTKYSTFDIPENDTWHKFFVNARLQELIEKYESIKPTLPLIPVDKSLLKKYAMNIEEYDTWVKENIDSLYYKIKEHRRQNNEIQFEVIKTEEFDKVLKKQELEEAIDKLKEANPYLYIGKRALSSKESNDTTKKSKLE